MPPSCHVICLPCLPATMWVVGPLQTVPLGHTWSGHGGVGLVVLAWDPLPRKLGLTPPPAVPV